MFPRKKKSRFPFEGPLRRLAGQSVRDERDRLLNDQVNEYLVVALMFCLLAAWEWAHRWFVLVHSAEVLTAMAIAIIGYCGFRCFRLRREIRNLNQAERGERRVSELLAELRGKRYIAFNDLLVTNANIDHVLVGPSGVFAIETKTYSIFGSGRVGVDENGVLRLGNKPALKNPLRQAAFAAQKVAGILEDRMHKPVQVTPVLIFLGWKLDGAKKETGVVVLTDANLCEFFQAQPRTLSDDQITAICCHLDQAARS
jgi:hypothetical protein